MKNRIIIIFLALGMSVLGWAGVTTFGYADYSGQGTSSSGSKITKTLNGVTVTSDKGYGNTDEVRIYSGGIITISASEAITKVEITSTASGSSKYGPASLAKNSSADAFTYTYSGTLGTATADDGATLTTVKLKATAQFRFTQIVVYTGGSVEAIAVDTVTLPISSYDLTVGQQYTLTATVLPANADNKKISWSSSDDTKISVSKGVVTAHKYTTTPVTITVTTEDGNKTASCAFTATKVTGPRYAKVKDAAALAVGDKVIFVNEDAEKVSGAYEMSTSSKRTYLTAVDAIMLTDTLVATNALDFTLGQSGSYWTLTAADGIKLGQKASTENRADMSASGDLLHSINISDNGNSAVVQSSGGVYHIGYNNSFRYYSNASIVGGIQLYKKVVGSDPQLTLSATNITFDTKALASGTATDTKTLTIAASDLKNENITIAMKHGTVFSVTPASVAHTGGSVTISYTATAEGTYTDTVVVTGKTVADAPVVRECAVSVTIDPTAATGTNVTYNLLQNLSDLHEGDKVFFGTAAKDYVMGLYNYSVASSNIRGAAAVYTADRHQVTANDLNAYTVSVSDGKYVFTGTDGKYLYLYNTNKNLSSSETLDNKAKWTIAIADDVATIKSVYSSSWTIYFNKTATNPTFCTYQSTPSTDANIAPVIIYSDNAPAYVEKVLNPSMTLKCGEQAIGDTLDWGEVVYDDSWGTEAAPYSESKSITILATDLSEAISVSLQTGTAFTMTTSSVPAKGGSFSVNFEVNAEGTYTDVLTITCGSLSKTIVLKAKAVRNASIDPATAPTVSVSTDSVAIAFGISETTSGITSFTFSATNLDKALYVKWLKTNTEPTVGYGTIEMLVGSQEVHAGETAQFAAPSVESTELIISATGYGAYSYSSAIQFYSYKADSKTELAIDKTIPFTVTVTSMPTGLSDVEVRLGDKIIRNGQILILRDGEIFDAAGRRVE